jgi:phospholipid/cholesterol/gamma-HCH transport system substrate-binding protein
LIKNLGLKVGFLVVLIAGVSVVFLIYVLFTHGVFDQSRNFILVSSNAEGISVGMPITFSGFPIGKVNSIRLEKNGEAQIEIRIPEKNRGWLREGSQFILERPIVGASKIKVLTSNFETPVLQERSKQNLIIGDASAEIPEIIDRAKRILIQIEALVNKESSLSRSLLKMETLFGKMIGEYGILEGILGSRKRAKQITDSLEHLNSIFESIDEVTEKGKVLLEKTEIQVFGKDGIISQVDRSIYDIQGLLQALRGILNKTDSVLDDAKSIGSNLKESTKDVDLLRKEIETNLRQIEHLIKEIREYLPVSESPEIRLP